MKHLIRLLLCAALLMGLCACGAQDPAPAAAPTPEPGPVSLWYVQDDTLTELLGALCTQAPKGLVTVRSFESELQMAAALDSQVPDLLVCGYAHAAGFFDDGLLSDLGPDCAGLCPPLLAEDYAGMGSSFFPLLADAWVLYANTARYEAAMGAPLQAEDLATVSRFCLAADRYTAETSQPFYTADGFSSLFAACLAQNDSEFYGYLAADMQNGDYVALYNLLAETAYARALQIFSPGEARALTEQGKVICSFLPAASVTQPAEGCTVLPLPMSSTRTPVVCSGVTGIAVTAPQEHAARCAEVLQLLYAMPQAAEPALSRGRIPFTGTAPAADDDAPETMLQRMGSECRFVITAPCTDHSENYSRFDALFRAAMQQLNNS